MTWNPFSVQTLGGTAEHSRRIIPTRVRLMRGSVNAADGECRVWIKAKKRNGYGVMGLNGILQAAHRVSFLTFKGPIPAGMLVLHSCDNPPCINPDHLRIGTYSDNMRECSDKGRLKIVFGRAIGEKSGSCKLTDAQVEEIRALLREGNLTQQVIADRFGVGNGHISYIKNGKTRTRCTNYQF